MSDGGLVMLGMIVGAIIAITAPAVMLLLLDWLEHRDDKR